MWLCVLPARGVENFKAGQAEVTIAGLRHYWYGAHALRKMSCLILKMIAKLLKLLVRLKALSAGSSIFSGHETDMWMGLPRQSSERLQT